jgi:hypothetical protein
MVVPGRQALQLVLVHHTSRALLLRAELRSTQLQVSTRVQICMDNPILDRAPTETQRGVQILISTVVGHHTRLVLPLGAPTDLQVTSLLLQVPMERGTPQQPPPGTTGGNSYNGAGPGMAQSSWNAPKQLVGPDPSTRKKGELWGAKAGEDLTMLQSFSAPGLTLEAQVRAADQSLDAVGLPGTSTQGSDDFQLARLPDAVLMMARGTMNTTSILIQGNVDTSFKLDKRTTLGTIKSVSDLEDRLQALTSGQHTVIEHVETNLKIVMMGAGYTAEDVALLAHDSPYLRISVDSQVAYIGLHMHLYNVGLQHCWDHLKTELHYHVRKLKEIRALYPTRLQIIAYNYCYLRDLQAHKWQTFGIQDLRIQELQAAYTLP